MSIRRIIVVSLFGFLLPAMACCQQPKTEQQSSAEQPAEPKKAEAPSTPGESAWQVLNQALTGDDSSGRTQAVAALSLIGPSLSNTELVEGFLHDKDASVRQAAIVTLGELKSRRSIPKLRRALDDESDAVRFSAARVLWNMGDTSGRLILIEVLAGERGASQGAAHAKIQELKKEMKNPAALAVFGVEQSGILGPFGIGLSLAEELRKDRSASARILAADALASDRNPGSADELEDALADKNWAVRAAAARAVAKRDDRHAIPALSDLLSDKNETVRYAAAAALVHLTHARRPAKIDREEATPPGTM